MKALGLALAAVLVAGCLPRLQPLEPGWKAPALMDDRLAMEDGVELPMRRWLPAGEPKAVVLALHGFNDYSHAFDEPAKAWAAAGIATYAYDQRGFGETPHRGLWAGEERMLADLEAASRLLRRRHPGTPFYILGESMGGALAMAAAAERPAADGLILVAPAVWGQEAQGPLLSAGLWVAAHTVPWLTLTGEDLEVRPSDNIEMLRRLAADPLVIKETRVDAIYGLTRLMDLAYAAAPRLKGRVLVLYGAREEVVPPKAARAMLQRLPEGPRVALYPEGYHMLLRDLRADKVRRDILAWIEDPFRALPSGGDRLAQRALSEEGDELRLAPVEAEQR